MYNYLNIIKHQPINKLNIFNERSYVKEKISKMVDVLVFGSANVDFITYVPRLPKPGETLHGTKFETCFGGKGANQCVAAAKLGASAALVAKVGRDSSGTDYINYLRGLRVNVESVDQIEGHTTGVAQIAVSEEGENNIIIVAGANATLGITDIGRATKLFDKSKILLCQLETPVEATITALRIFRGVSILNAAPALSDMPQELLCLATILCVNEIEAVQITGRQDIQSLDDAKATAVRLIEMGANKVVITMGANGVVCLTNEPNADCLHVPAPNVERVIDTTGAGDAFIGGLAYYLSHFPNLPLEYHISAACEIAAHSIQYRGTQPSFPDSTKAEDCDICSMDVKFTKI